MTIQQAVDLLRQHNKWRLGDEDLEQLDPKLITEAIDTAIEFIVSQKTYRYGQRWTIEVGFDQITLYYFPIEGGPPTVSAYDTFGKALEAAKLLT